MEITENFISQLKQGYTECRIIYEDEQPVDFEFLNVNQLFSEMLNMNKENIEGQKAGEIFSTSNPEFLETFAEITTRNISTSFKTYHPQIDCQVEVSVISCQDKNFIALYDIVNESNQGKLNPLSRKKQREIFIENFPGMAYKCGEKRYNWKMEYVSEGCRELTGYSPRELIKAEQISYGSIIKPSYREYVWEEIQTALENHDKFDLEYKILTRGQKEKWVRERGQAIFNDDGSLRGIFGYITDITELKEQKERSESLFENISSAIAIVDNDGIIIDINSEFEKVFLHSQDIVKGEHIDDVLDKGENNSVSREKTYKVLQGQQINTKITRYDKTGKAREFLFTGAPITVENEVVGAYAIYDDITELVRTREKLDIREEQYRKIFNKSPAGMQLLNKEGIILQVNEAYSQMTDYEREKLEGSSIFETVVPDELEAKARKNIGRILQGEDLEHIVKNYNKTGEEIYVLLKETAIRLPDGSKAILSMQMDYTKYHEQRQKIKYISYHDDLTGLYNRNYVEEKLKEINKEESFPLSIMMADINGLRLINNTYGHETGDELLIKVANIFQECKRKNDILARWSGDEFILFMPHTNIEEAKVVRNNLLHRCGDIKFKEDVPVTLGTGVACKHSSQADKDIFETLYEAEDHMRQDKLTKNRSTESRLVENLISTLGAKSKETEDHARRMQELALALGKKLNISNKKLNELSLLSKLHDIGKATISEKILNKPGNLTDEEWEIIKEHPERGYRIASASPEFAPIAKYILHHHEHWNGEGYPEGVEGKNIPLLSRIIAIVDAFDVMTNGRPYKEPMSKEEAIEELKSCAGSQFDPYLVRKFVEVLQQ